MEDKEQKFSVIAEAIDYQRPLYLINLSFGRLIDDVVMPYQIGDAFFIDGAPLKRDKLIRIKIVKQYDVFGSILHDLHWKLRETSSIEKQKIYGEQYETRFAAILREAGEDVTSQVIKAYDRSIKPSIRDYIPKREELISAALTIFTESLKALGKSP